MMHLYYVFILFHLCRYAIRTDENPNLKQGVVAAFSVTRTLSLIDDTSMACSAHWSVLDCGPPFHYFTVAMVFAGLVYFIESSIAFAGSAYVLDILFEKNLLKKFK